MKTMSKLTKSIISIPLLFIVFFLNITYAYALSISVDVPEKYVEVVAGERFYFEIEIKYPENYKRKDLRIEYQIIKDGKVFEFKNVLKAIETQASFMDFIVVPENAKNGLYTINVIISDYSKLKKEVSTSFYVTESKSTQMLMYFLIIIATIVLSALLVGVQIFITKGKFKK